MGKKSYSFILAHRKRWALTQEELARLLLFSSGSTVSRIERSQRPPVTATLIACSIVFGFTPPDLFPTLYDQIEEAVVTAAKILHDESEGATDKRSKRKRALLEAILSRATGRNQSHGV
jgi:transcriptional regulator with XRE-family HTH domain